MNNRRISIVLLVVVFALISLIAYYTPLAYDDWKFRHVYLELNNGSDGFSFRAIWRVALDLRIIDSARLSNVLDSVIVAVPCMHQIFPFLAGATVVCLIFFVCRIGLGRLPGWKALAVSAAACLIFLPWRDSMFVPAYTLNYPCVTVISLAFISLLLDSIHNSFGKYRNVMLLVLAMLVGLWHEGFAVTILAGGGVLTLVRRWRMPCVWYVAAIVLMLSTMLLCLSPGIMRRISNNVGDDYTIVPLHFVMNNFAFILLVLMTLLSLSFRRLRVHALKSIDSDVFIMCSSTAVAGTVMLFTMQASIRMSFWPSCMAMVAMWRLYSSLPKPHFVLRAIAACVSAAIVMTVGINALYWQRQYCLEDVMLKELIDSSKDGTVYYDIDHFRRENCPRLALNIPLRNYWYNKFNMEYMVYDTQRSVGVVPSTLRTFDVREAESVPGNAGYKRYRNCLIYLPQNEDDRPCENLRYTFYDGSVISISEYYTYRFVNDDGQTLFYHKAWKINPDRIERIDTVW